MRIIDDNLNEMSINSIFFIFNFFFVLFLKIYLAQNSRGQFAKQGLNGSDLGKDKTVFRQYSKFKWQKLLRRSSFKCGHHIIKNTGPQ